MLSVNFYRIFFLGAIIFASSISIFGQTSDRANKTEISFEIDPSTFAFKGYGIHLRVKPKGSDHLVLGIGTYAMDFPSVFVDLNKENKDKGWDVRLNQGYGLFTEYHFSEVNKKWFLGGQLALQEYKIKKEALEGDNKYSNLLLMGLGGDRKSVV
ncbi:MAG TPA: hypothetical protein ENK75_03665, partial [Saprospiraceae bacterium]|nr:hypothetical protein [Saprospiraceae bacterium]